MPYKKLLAVVTMMMITGTKADAQQVVTIDELRQIESLIGQKDCGALFSFLVANPHTTAGQDALARELRGFVQNVNSGSLECFSAPVTAQQNAGRLALSATSSGQIY
jgi:hypothetical protein